MTKKIKRRLGGDDKYFEFLADIVDKDNYYTLLLKQLHNTEFYSIVPNDDNRANDGKKLREIFLDEIQLNKTKGRQHGPSFISLIDRIDNMGNCTVLEMLIGLSLRMEFELEDNCNMNVSHCFWMLMEHLNLHWCTDDSYYENAFDDVIDEIIRILLNREYDDFGNGGLFPLKNPNKDQRKVEIWYQMNAYLLENYTWW